MVVLMLSYSIRVMDPNSSLGKFCLGENVVEISSDKVEGSGDWNSPEFQYTANNGQKKETKAMIFHQMDTEEVSDRFVAPLKLCLEHEVKRGNKVVKKELIVALRGEIYFVKFIINPKEDDVEPRVILRRSFLPGGHLTQEEVVKEALEIKINKKFALLEEVRPVIETMAYHDKYKKILDEIWKDKVELDGKIVKEEEEAIKRIKGEALKEKDDPGAFIFPIRLEGKIGVTTLIAKFLILDIPIDCDAPIVVGWGFLCMIGGIVNTQERLLLSFFGFCHQTFRAARSNVMRNAESDNDDEEEYEIKRNKFGAPIYGPKPVQYLNCNDPTKRSLAIQTTMGAHDDEVGSSRSKCSRQHETVEEVLLPQVYHEFLLWEGCNRDVKSRMGCDGEIDAMLRIKLREAESNEEIFNSMMWIRAFNINEPIFAKLCQDFYSTYEFNEVCADDELLRKKIIKFRLGGHAHNLTLLEFAHRLGLYHADELEEDGFDLYFQGGLRSDDNFNAQEYWLSISQEENFGLSRSHTSTIRSLVLRVIHKMITYGLCQRTTRWMKRKGAGTQKESKICCGPFVSKIARKSRVLTDDVIRRLSAPIYCRDLDTTPLRDLIDSEGRLILEDP
ncbi:hypothetical protein Tco_0761185 [Tanacetum coccineum]